jgi:hypothetical protein
MTRSLLKKLKGDNMLLRIIAPLIVFFISLSVHMYLSIYETVRSIRSLDPELDISYWGIYTSSLDNFTGFSIALGTLFITYAIVKYKQTGTRNIIKGSLISIIIFLIMSFAMGFYTVSIEQYYINKIAWYIVTIKKMIILPVTIISIIPGYIFIFIKTRKKYLINN